MLRRRTLRVTASANHLANTTRRRRAGRWVARVVWRAFAI